MTLSVVVSSYNRPDSLRIAVASALEQSQVDEVIVVDDASDTSPDLSGLDPRRLRFERHPVNRGICATRNTGLSMVRTEHVTFLDDDDRLLPAAFQPLIDALGDSLEVVTGMVIVERGDKTEKVRYPPSSTAGQVWGLDEFLLAGGERSFGCKQSAVFPVRLMRDAGAWNEDLRYRIQ